MTFKPPKPPDGCVSSADHERALVAIAIEAEDKARQLLAESGPRFGATAKEFMLCAVRARKQAAELAGRREDEHRIDLLLEHERRRLGIEGSERPRRKLVRR